MASAQDIFKIRRPHTKLMLLYLIRAVLTGPLIVFILPFYYFRYHSMRYHFDEEGIHQRWGILFRREINLTYARIQDIHLTSGIIQRWLGLADIKIQTASAGTGAEMTIEGFLEFEAIRDFLYSQMRGMQRNEPATGPDLPGRTPILADPGETVAILTDIRDELRNTRLALQDARGPGKGSHEP